MDFMFPVTSIVFLNESDVSTVEFDKTLKSKNTNIKINRKEVKIVRPYTYIEKKLLTKQIVKAEFSIFCDFDQFKTLFKSNQEVVTIEIPKVVFKNKEKLKNFELYNCNVTIEMDLNFKCDKESTVTIKMEAQGKNGLYFDIKNI